MKNSICIFAAAALAALVSGCGGGSALAPQTSSQDVTASTALAGIPQYHLVALASLGGSVVAGISDNERDWVSGYSLLSGNSVINAAVWYPESTSAVDLGTLGGGNSAVEWPNHTANAVVGISQIAKADPLGEQWSCSYPAGAGFLPYTGQECRGFVWSGGAMRPLGTLGGNNSFATGSNARGQIVGWAETGVHDSTCISPQVLQFEAVMWDRARDAQVLRPLGNDPDSAATAINNRGYAVGISGICQNAVGARSAERMAIWKDGTPSSIPTLGGSAWNTPEMINERNQVVGFSDLPGDRNGAYFNGHAFLWPAAGGRTADLGVLPGDAVSFAYSINNRGQIVGQSCTSGCASSRAFLYQNGTMHDLNALLDASSASYDLIFANDVNDEGQITGLAVDQSNGSIVAFRLEPTGALAQNSSRSVTIRSASSLHYHLRIGPFGRPIVQ